MLKNSLLEILRTFSREDTKKLNDFIYSPYFNKKSPVTKLWDYIKKFAPDYKSENLNREIVWKNLFPKKEFNYGVMKNLIWSLQKLAERFIELQIHEQNRFERKNNLLSGLLKNNLISLFEKNLKSVKSEIQEIDHDPECFYYKYLFEAEEQNYFYHFRKVKEPGFCNPFPMSEYLSSSFFVKFFAENYNSLYASKFYNKSYDTGFITEAFKFFENSLSKNDENVLAIYYSLKILMDTDDLQSFNRLKKILVENYKKFSPETSFNIAVSLTSHCSYLLMNGKLNFVNDQFEICKLLVENDLYNGDDLKNIAGNIFVTIVNAASLANEFAWAEKFINDFKEKLYPDKKEYFLFMALITFNIKRKNFEEALNFLSKAESKELIQKINIKRYQIMIYYELGYNEELYSFIDSSKHFISNDVKSSEAVKKTFFNFISLVLKLLSFKTNDSKSKEDFEFENLKKEILEAESTNKIWLLEKIAELEK